MALVISTASSWQSTPSSFGTLTVSSVLMSASAGDMLLAIHYSDAQFASISDSNGGTWTLAASDGWGGRIYYRTFTASELLTVTTAATNSIGINQKILKVRGFEPSGPIGAVGFLRLNNTVNYTPTVLTSTVSGSSLVFTANDINASGVPSFPGSGDLISTSAYVCGTDDCGLAGYKNLGAPDPQTANVFSAGSSPNWCWMAVEIIPFVPPTVNAGATSATTTSTSAAAINTSPLAQATSTTTTSGTATATVSSPAGAVSATVTTTTALIPVAFATSPTATTSTTAVTVTDPLLAGATSATTSSSTTAVALASPAGAVSSTSSHDRTLVTRGGATPVLAPYGSLTIGRFTLTEPVEVSVKGGDTRTVSLSGLDADQATQHPTQDEIRARSEALLAYSGTTVPVIFTAFPHLSGWYRVDNPGNDTFQWYETTAVEWTVDLVLVATDSQAEFESRLVGGNRVHASAATARLWHAAPIGSDSYTVGTSSPGYVTRTSADGNVLVFLDIPAGGNPRWGVAGASYLRGAATVTVGGNLLTGTSSPDTPASWRLDNGLLRVEPATGGTGTLLLTGYLTSSWGTSRVFDIKRNGTSLRTASHVTVVRNDPCEAVLRLTWDHAPGRSTVDLVLKRGARHVALTAVQSTVAGPWRIDDTGPGGIYGVTSLTAGWTTELHDDPDGNRWVIGSSVACSWPGMFGLVADTAAAVLPGFIGVVRGGSSAVAGDAAADINAQWLGDPAETERLVRR